MSIATAPADIVLFGCIGAILCVLVWRLRDRRTGPLVLGCVLVISLLHQLLYRTIAEDAYIAFRYSRHFAAGHGLVFNVGERVEGYSDFLWVSSLGLINRLSGAYIPITAAVLSSICALFAIVLTWRLAGRLTGSAIFAAVAGVLVAASSTFSAYGPTGLESALFAAFILLFFFAVAQDRSFQCGVLIALATMTRPDGILLAAPLLAYLVLRVDLTWADRFRRIGAAAGGAISLGVPWTIWRVSYYGYLIPNALAAKMGMNFFYQIRGGIAYVSRFAFVHLPVAGAAAALAGPVFRKLGRHDVNTALAGALAFFALFYTAFIAVAGGDWMPAYRFLVPVVPVMAVLLSYFCAQTAWVRRSFQGWRGPAALAVACILMVSASMAILVPKFRNWDQKIVGLSEIGSWLHDSVPRDVTTACFACGALPYYSQLPTLDMLGLCDEHIARKGRRSSYGTPGHIAYDYDYVAARKPAIIAFLAGNGFGLRPESPVNIETERWRDYEVVGFHFLKSTNACGQYVTLLILRSEKERLVPALIRQGEIDLVPGPIKTSSPPFA